MKMQLKHGKKEFNIIPETYVLPDGFNDFYNTHIELKARHKSALWIIKPNGLSRGRGIYIVF